MDKEIQALDSAVSLAYNLKPKNAKKTGKTRKETEEIIGQIVKNTQASLMAYKALRRAVLESDDSQAISKRATEILDHEIQKMEEQ